MKTVLKILGMLTVLGLIAAALLVYAIFNGNPIDAYRSQRMMEGYLAETYPGKAFKLQAVQYDAKFGRYQAKVTDSAGREFTIAGDPGGVQYDQYHWTYNMDQLLTERFDAQLSNALAELLRPAYPQYRQTDTGAYVAVDMLPADAQFAVGMERDWRFEIYLVGPEVPEDIFLALTLEVRDTILQAGYHPRAMRFLYNEPENADSKGGMLYYTLRINEDDYAKTAADLRPGIELFNQKHRK